MLVLAINTVGDSCEAALLGDGGILASRAEPMTQGHDARLAPLVERVLSEAGVQPNQLDRIAVVSGPGSFTGVRVGLAFARGLALALDKPAIGVTSLEALDNLPPGRVLGLLAARRRPPERSWWAQVLVDGRGTSDPIEADETLICSLASGVTHAAGEFDGALTLSMTTARPTAEAAAHFAAKLTGDLPPPRPIYIRAPDAAPARPIIRP